jgi:hypothetical protein
MGPRERHRVTRCCGVAGDVEVLPAAGSLRAEVNGEFHRLVAGRLDADERAALAGLLVVDRATRQSALPTLTQPAPRATVSRLKQHVATLAWLDQIGPTGQWLAGVPPAKISHFAGEAAVLDADELSRVGEDKRLTLLAWLVHIARIRARDEVVTMFCKRMASSIANGSPSSRAQTAATTAALRSSRANPGVSSRARSTNSRTARRCVSHRGCHGVAGRQGQRWHRELPLAGEPQWSPAGDHDAQLRGGVEQPAERGRTGNASRVPESGRRGQPVTQLVTA